MFSRARWSASLAVVVGLFAGTACKQDEPPGFTWDLHFVASIDDCHPEGEGIPYEGDIPYTLRFDGGNVTVYIEDQAFATGTISGCNLTYDTVVWGEPYDGYEIRWQLHGEAEYRQGGGSCSLDNGTDWQGTETFTIISTTDPDETIEPGCEYILDVEGTYSGEAE